MSTFGLNLIYKFELCLSCLPYCITAIPKWDLENALNNVTYLQLVWKNNDVKFRP